MANLSRLPKVLQSSYEWQYEGACMGLDSARFFSPDAERGTARSDREGAAKAICATCPVIDQCRQHALEAREPYGVWGGLTERERTEILKESDRQRVAS
ncbi:WhiB family transcriptional regulator [Aeromicrobium sp. CF4.19]|uniref:WhiB family transcriptional regulator n=1 Tax=Aeromicrobium sp. CF4.19 TaxID=3373082 RepID=UPI003EE42B2C